MQKIGPHPRDAGSESAFNKLPEGLHTQLLSQSLPMRGEQQLLSVWQGGPGPGLLGGCSVHICGRPTEGDCPGSMAPIITSQGPPPTRLGSTVAERAAQNHARMMSSQAVWPWASHLSTQSLSCPSVSQAQGRRPCRSAVRTRGMLHEPLSTRVFR